MSSKDDPFDPTGKTVIRPSRPNPGRKQKTVLARDAPAPGSTVIAPASVPEPTVFDPNAGRQPPSDVTGTVIYQGTPFANAPADPPVHGSAGTAGKTPWDALLGASDAVDYGAANPIVAAAAPLLILLGHLRLMAVERPAEPLAQHVAGLIEDFDRKIARTDTSEEDARIASYVLCETADDIVANLPGSSRDAWAQHAMLQRFFQVKPTGAGFFQALNTVLATPEPHRNLIELMHVCLSLGFEGQYRGQPRESLERVRRDAYETSAYFRVLGDDDISPRWQGLSVTSAQGSRRVPLWAIAAATAAVLTAAFFTLRVLITNDGEAVAGELLALNPATPVTIERTGFVPLTEEVKVVAAPTTIAQVDRIRTALAKEIEGGGVSVGTKGDFIIVEISNALLFQSGRAEVKPEFEPVAASIAAALDAERGPIRIVGHTDNVKPKKTSAFKSNFDLSVARAQSVEKMIAAHFSDPSRTKVEGKGEDEPIADNATPEGRAKNRRVDVMIPREEML
ncbi:type VI secretion system protein TssL, long form [Mesorhizobium sp. M1060]|uniref:type VI secretion system protein TssL, long form n=1 Tax=unclassified Mesorhizobium TaxID=325217 RepID=UPI0003CFF159|nr:MULTISPECIES: type VI secretion system protein TssL, long form [unclassified Mesorhizobium]ESZ09821.1 type IV / vi secretion system protein, dotu family [Mesorhizobium sp. L2C089B000]WJI50922.1 type VI secretion system protein TssL, long form [Mesorhizobium sp. C089B]